MADANEVSVADPHDRYDDLLTVSDEESVDAETFETMTENEAFTAGWVAAGVVHDDADRLLLALEGGTDDERWVAPGGSVKPGESLSEALVREVREETGVEVDPVRPRAVAEHAIVHGDDRLSFRVVLFEARAETTAVGDDLGEPGEAIEDAGWFEELPDRVFERELLERVLRRVRSE
ncbi:NUDIX hydrolase [Halobium palmae]|uniref:NUDIX hydrolase n=1 Tax=Halobium palmae TaxID=1776492 RepID=A0ABD5S0D7_9EURY